MHRLDAIRSQNLIRSWVEQGKEICALLKKITPEKTWSEIAEELTTFKKCFRASNPHKDELHILLEIKKTINEELAHVAV